jgi:hypothetical protein
MSADFKIFGYRNKDDTTDLVLEKLTPQQVQFLATKRKVLTLFNIHFVSTLASLFYSIYVALPRFSPSLTQTAQITSNFGKLNQRNTFVFTAAMAVTLAIHTLYMKRQNQIEKSIQNLCAEKLQNKQFMAYLVEQKSPQLSIYYCISKNEKGRVVTSAFPNENELDAHAKNTQYAEMFLSALLPNTEAR